MWYFLVIQTKYCLLHFVCVFCYLGQVESGGSLCEPCVWHSPVAPAAGYYWQDKWAGTRVWNPVLPRANQGVTGKHPSETCHTDTFSSLSDHNIQLWSKLENMSKEGFKNISALCILFRFHKSLTFHENDRKISLWNVYPIHCYLPLFTTSICQDNSADLDLMLLENTWQGVPYRIYPDPSNSQVHVGAAPLQFTLLIFYKDRVRGMGWPMQNLHFVFSDSFLCSMFVLDHCPDRRPSHGPL